MRRSIRSLSMNRYLWAIYREMSAATGHSTLMIHDQMCLLLLPRDPIVRKVSNWPDGTVRTITRDVRHTSQLSPNEFQKFISDVRLFSKTFLNLTIEDPDYTRFGPPCDQEEPHGRAGSGQVR